MCYQAFPFGINFPHYAYIDIYIYPFFLVPIFCIVLLFCSTLEHYSSYCFHQWYYSTHSILYICISYPSDFMLYPWQPLFLLLQPLFLLLQPLLLLLQSILLLLQPLFLLLSPFFLLFQLLTLLLLLVLSLLLLLLVSPPAHPYPWYQAAPRVVSLSGPHLLHCRPLGSAVEGGQALRPGAVYPRDPSHP